LNANLLPFGAEDSVERLFIQGRCAPAHYLQLFTVAEN